MNIAEVKTKIDSKMNIISELTDLELDNLLNLVGYYNAMAHKGYKKLSDQEARENAAIYCNKNKYIYALVSEFVRRGRTVAKGLKGNKVVYFYRIDGIQVSFHTNIFLTCNDDYEDKIYKIINKTAEWDGVEHAYEYSSEDIEEYNRKKNTYKDMIKNLSAYKDELKKQELESIVKYLSRYNRYKKYCDEFSPETNTIGYKKWSCRSEVYYNVFGLSEDRYFYNYMMKCKKYIDDNYSDYVFSEISGEIKEKEPKKYKGE